MLLYEAGGAVKSAGHQGPYGGARRRVGAAQLTMGVHRGHEVGGEPEAPGDALPVRPQPAVDPAVAGEGVLHGSFSLYRRRVSYREWFVHREWFVRRERAVCRERAVHR